MAVTVLRERVEKMFVVRKTFQCGLVALYTQLAEVHKNNNYSS